jgi:meiotic recombination protein DMC1
MATRRSLCKIKGLSENKVDKIKEAASKITVIPKSLSQLIPIFVLTIVIRLYKTCSFITAMDVSHARQKVFKISTGSKQLDILLGGE